MEVQCPLGLEIPFPGKNGSSLMDPLGRLMFGVTLGDRTSDAQVNEVNPISWAERGEVGSVRVQYPSAAQDCFRQRL